MNLRPSHPAGAALGPLAGQVQAVPAGGAVPDVRVTGVTLRSGDVEPGDLFAALPGAAAHGARFASEALERGA
ncbi:hypothetical protein A5650_04100 [Mycobacterium sp. 1164985.4]|nr:hypothetical protein A5650_04100 [Mycobacterium sp. 1164985.4]